MTAVIIDPGGCTHPLEVQKILECLTRNKAPPFDKVALNVCLLILMSEHIDEIRKNMERSMPVIIARNVLKLYISLILDIRFYIG